MQAATSAAAAVFAAPSGVSKANHEGAVNETVAKIEKLTPPILSKETEQYTVVCTRPRREGNFNISLEKNGNQTCVHCYGHGGSGWTTLFGSVNKAIKLFTDTNPDKTVPVRVIGSGCMGLTTAIELKRLGFQVTISSKDESDVPSWKAAGYFALVSVNTSPEEKDDVNQIGMYTFKTYQKIDRGEHPYLPKEAVRFMPVYCSEDTDSGIQDLEEKKEIPLRERVTLDFGNGVRHENFVKFMTYFMNTAILMTELKEQVRRLEIPLIVETIHSFGQIKEAVVFNCTGLGARQLNNDDKMTPVTGHLHLLNAKAGEGHMDYMIYSKVKDDDGKDAYVYMFPKCLQVNEEFPHGFKVHATLGGTFIRDTDTYTEAQLEELDQVEFKKLLDRNSMFFYGMPLQ